MRRCGFVVNNLCMQWRVGIGNLAAVIHTVVADTSQPADNIYSFHADTVEYPPTYPHTVTRFTPRGEHGFYPVSTAPIIAITF